MSRVGKAKRAHASIACGKDGVGTALDAPLPTLHSLQHVAAKFSTTRGLWDGNRTRRRAFYPAEERNVECVMKEELTTIRGGDARRARRACRLPCVRRPQRRTDDRQAGRNSRASGGRQGHAVAPRLRGPKRAATNVGRGELMGCGTTLCERHFLFCECGMKNPAYKPLSHASPSHPTT